MKKLITLLISISLISCSHEFISEQEIKEIQYEQAFIQKFGNIDKNQTWGFNQMSTRSSYPNSNEWSTQGYKVPEAITADEIQKVKAVFDSVGVASYTALVDWNCFFVQHVYGNHSNMDYLCSYDPEGHEEIIYVEEHNNQPWSITSYDDHIFNFNATSGSIQLMVNSSTHRFGFHSSQDSKMHYWFRMKEIDGNYYVGIDYEANGKSDNQKEARNYIYNDWVVKIVPGKGITDKVKEEGMIICEDLGTIGDFDFNDVVFYAKVWESGKTEITLYAAGGKLDASVAEVNVGEAMGKMVNTGLYETDFYYFESVNKYNSLIDIPVVIRKTDAAGNITSYELTAQMGKAPQKICVPLGFRWCKEYKSLVDAYPGFKDWTTGKADTWCGEYNPELVMDLTNFNF
jgi:hypothetical protein